jgi:hypothetical protein
MAQLAGRRMAAEIDGDFVVFLIGARPNDPLHLLRSYVDLGGRRGMRHMYPSPSRPGGGTACTRRPPPADRRRPGRGGRAGLHPHAVR